MMSTACESMPDTQPGGQGSCGSDKRPDELGVLRAVHGIELRSEIVEERLYTLHDELSLFLVLWTEENTTCGIGVPLPYKRKSLPL